MPRADAGAMETMPNTSLAHRSTLPARRLSNTSSYADSLAVKACGPKPGWKPILLYAARRHRGHGDNTQHLPGTPLEAPH
jgi:hypothetical protein